MERTTPKKDKPDGFPHIMVCDPSIVGWGYVIIDYKGSVKKAVVIKTNSEAKKRRIRKGDDRIRRVNEINSILLEDIRDWNVKAILTEQPHGSQSASAAIMIGIVIGVIQTMSDCLGIPVEWYSEGDSKNALLGKRSATKEETIRKVKQYYDDVPWTGIGFRDEAIADSMSIYHLARKTSTLIKFLSQS